MKESEEIKKYLNNWKWRISSWKLYKIKDKAWNVIPFIPNKEQLHFYKNLHNLNCILKARQKWFSTAIQILMLDQTLFYNNISCWVIAQTLKDAKNIFDNKIKFAYENLPGWLKEQKTLEKDSTDTLQIKETGSSIYVSTSFRWGTLQYLHISEYWPICSKFPDRAREIKTWALESVWTWNYVFIESTASWKEWDFYEKCENAKKIKEIWKPLNQHEYKFFFYPWYWSEEYRLYDSNLILTSDTIQYFEELENSNWIKVDEAQKKWYQSKKEKLLEDMFSEYPSTPEEAFRVASEWSYYAKRVNEVYSSKRLTKVPYEPELPVYTWWDLWWAWWWDNMDIWFFQIYNNEFRFIDWFTGIGFSIEDIHNEILRNKPYNFEAMFLPFDANVASLNDKKTRAQALTELWYKVYVLAKTSKSDRRDNVRNNFKYCWFDKEKCSNSLDLLKEYRKKWNESIGGFIDEEEKNEARHTADSFWYSLQAITSRILLTLDTLDNWELKNDKLNDNVYSEISPSDYSSRKTLDQIIFEEDEKEIEKDILDFNDNIYA